MLGEQLDVWQGAAETAADDRPRVRWGVGIGSGGSGVGVGIGF